MADKLPELHDLLVESLLAKIRSGEATAADLNVARQFLKDNGISNTTKNPNMDALVHEAVPFTETDEYGLPN